MNALRLSGCKLYFWCDSGNVLLSIQNQDFCLDKFISRRIVKLLLYFELENWRYSFTSVNPADDDSSPDGLKKSKSRELWFFRTEFLRHSDEIPEVKSNAVSVKRVTCFQDKNESSFSKKSGVNRIIEAAFSFICCRSEWPICWRLLSIIHGVK